MIKLKLVIFIFLFTAVAFGQNQNRNLVYFELGGNGLFLSLNAEKELLKNSNVYGHLGLGIYGIKPTYLTIPFGASYLLKLKNKNNAFEFGLGATYTKANVKLYTTVDHRPGVPQKVQYFNFIPGVSYRHHTQKNLMYKFSFTPVFNQYGGLPFLGFSIGKLF